MTHRKLSRWQRVGIAVVAFASVWMVKGGAVSAADEAAVKRGEYVFTAAGCGSCHTDASNGGKPLAGGRALETPFGTFFSPNITPDPQFGIGRWSDADFRGALREGIGPDRVHLFPVFPFTSFTGMTDRDLADLHAYLAAQPPVPQANKPHEAKPPFGWRLLMVFWRSLFFTEGPLQPVPEKSEEWNRGNYLVNAVAHCGECHSPRNMLGALKEREAFSGNIGGPDHQNAPNITPDPETGIGTWSNEDIMRLLKTGETAEFDAVSSGMREVVRGTAQLTDADRRAIAVYLKSLPPIRSNKPR